MSQTNSLKLMEPLPSWSISPINSWQKWKNDHLDKIKPLTKGETWPCWQQMIVKEDQAPDKGGESLLLWTAPKRSSSIILPNEKEQNKNEARAGKPEAPGRTGSSQTCASPCWEKESHEDEDSISTWKPMQIYKSFHTVRTRFTQKPSNYIWLLSNPVKSPSFNFPRTCPSSSVEIAPPPPLKNWNENLVLKRNRASKWRERFR